MVGSSAARPRAGACSDECVDLLWRETPGASDVDGDEFLFGDELLDGPHGDAEPAGDFFDRYQVVHAMGGWDSITW